MQTYADVIGLWDSAEQFGADLDILGVTARAWRNRNSIPPERWKDVVAAAQRRGFAQVTTDLLAEIAARSQKPTTSRRDRLAGAAA
jgi:hypothetical protein